MKAVALVHPRSLATRPRLVARLRAALGPGAVRAPAGHEALARAAREALEASPEVLLVGGGDGTFVRTLAALDQAAGGRPLPALLPLPWGTGNGLARSLGLGRASPRALDAALATARAGARRAWPLLSVLGLRAPFAGFGVDAAIIADHARVRAALPGWLPAAGALAYLASVPALSLPGFVRGPRPQVTARALAPAVELDRHGAAGRAFATGDVLWQGALTLAACSTVRCFGFGLAMFPHADGRGDRFVVRIGDAGLGEIVTRAADAFAGRYFSPRVHDLAATAVALEVDRPQPFEVAGEAMGLHRAVEIRLAPPIVLAL